MKMCTTVRKLLFIKFPKKGFTNYESKLNDNHQNGSFILNFLLSAVSILIVFLLHCAIEANEN